MKEKKVYTCNKCGAISTKPADDGGCINKNCSGIMSQDWDKM